MHGTSEEHDIRTKRQMNVRCHKHATVNYDANSWPSLQVFWILCVAMFAWQVRVGIVPSLGVSKHLAVLS